MQPGQLSSMNSGNLRVGDYVEVKPITDIMVTLNSNASLDALPFMPEMIRHCGRRYRIVKIAHKTCDPTGSSHLRRVVPAVHLDTRCDGEAHGGCQAGCLFFWHVDWLKRAVRSSSQGSTEPLSPIAKSDSFICGIEALRRATLSTDTLSGDIRYRCQATELVRFSTPISSFEPTQYMRDLSSGNVSFREFILSFTRAFLKSVAGVLTSANVWSVAKKMLQPANRIAQKPMIMHQGKPTEALDLQPGDLVRVRTEAEIRSTLDTNGTNRGLSFDPDMVSRAGGVYRVSKRVERVIDEKTGKLLKIRKDCVVLDGVYCTGNHNCHRLFCPRGAFQFWRECWLQRIGTIHQKDEAPSSIYVEQGL